MTDKQLIRFKADFTIEASSIDEVKEAFARYLLNEVESLPEYKGANDGWCCGPVDSFHYALACW